MTIYYILEDLLQVETLVVKLSFKMSLCKLSEINPWTACKDN